MKTEKLSLKSIKNVLSRSEMKKIMAGSGGCVSECRSGETCSNGYHCMMVNCMGSGPTTLMGIC